jgi:uncharacterized protein YdiU (UPF0061 family)
MPGWRLEHTYTELPPIFYSDAAPTPVREPRMVVFNRPLAEALGLDAESLTGPQGAEILGGNVLPDGARPIAQAYAGHQFGHFTGLGDGRAILLGEQITPAGERFDIQLKGPGKSRYSRRGDGRAALGPMLREYLISEAMYALGIPTTRSLAVVATGEPVYRETVLQGAVLTRVAASHIRVGTMQWAAAHDAAATRALADYTIARHYPDLAPDLAPGLAPDFAPGLAASDLAAAPDRYLALFEAIVKRQALLITRWQLVGFIHGVMNTDNMALSGETIDYGPCAFMDAYDPATVFSSIDQGGRYAYGNQPPIAQWNLARLAEAMLPLFDENGERAVQRATEVLNRFQQLFEEQWLDGMRAKLGLFTREPEDEALVNDLLALMRAESADFTNTFRSLTLRLVSPETAGIAAAFEPWLRRWEARRERQPQSSTEAGCLMRRSNPAFIPRNHRVEEALAAANDGDLSVMHRLLDVLASPFDYERKSPEYTESGTKDPKYRTFCGT